MRTKIAGVISIFAFFAIDISLSEIAETFGLKLYIYRNSEQISTQLTIYFVIISMMLAWRIYRWIVFKNISGNIDKTSHATWIFWFIGLTLYILITTPLWYVHIPIFIKNITNTAIAIGIIVIFVKLYKAYLSKIQDKNDDTLNDDNF